jgi:hypothetical protein
MGNANYDQFYPNQARGQVIRYHRPWRFERENTLILGAAGHGLYRHLLFGVATNPAIVATNLGPINNASRAVATNFGETAAAHAPPLTFGTGLGVGEPTPPGAAGAAFCVAVVSHPNPPNATVDAVLFPGCQTAAPPCATGTFLALQQRPAAPHPPQHWHSLWSPRNDQSHVRCLSPSRDR